MFALAAATRYFGSELERLTYRYERNLAMKRSSIWLFMCCCLSWSAAAGARADEIALPSFKAQTIDDQVRIGYGTAIGDVDGDGKPDILLVDKKQIVWYQNPPQGSPETSSWKRHVIVENLTVRDNVCIAARDIDGDGKVEIAVGGQWNPGDTYRSGSVHYLVAPEDRTKKWKAIKLYNEPVIHRMRWQKVGENRFLLLVAPLHGKGNRGGKGVGVKLLAYRQPADGGLLWKRAIVDDTLHVTHNFDPVQWDPGTPAEEILYAGREGAMLIYYDRGEWIKKKLPRVQGAGEIRMGLLSKAEPYIVTIEPLHGNKLVFYKSGFARDRAASASNDPAAIESRIVLDDNLSGGHAIATADLFGNGSQQIVAGWRLPNRDKKVGIKLYYPTNKGATTWKSMVIDDNGMACEDIRIGDLNGDGRPDIVAAGRATNNLKIYWNQAPK